MLKRSVRYSVAAIKILNRIDRATSERIKSKILQLAENPMSLRNNIRPLNGDEGYFRLRVGDWRVIYSETLEVLSIIRVAPRGSAYD